MVPDQNYIEQLIVEYGDMVYRLAISQVKNKEEAEDIFQEVFMKIYEKMPEFVSKENEKYWRQMELPLYDAGKYYKGMNTSEHYTLEELGL